MKVQVHVNNDDRKVVDLVIEDENNTVERNTRVKRVSLSRILCPWIAGLLTIGAVTGIIVGVVVSSNN